MDPFFESTTMEQGTCTEPPHAEQATINEGAPKLGLGISVSREDVGMAEPDLGSCMNHLRRAVHRPLPVGPVDPRDDGDFAIRQ